MKTRGTLRRSAVALVSAAALVTLVGCGGDDDDAVDTTTPTPETTAAPATSAPPPTAPSTTEAPATSASTSTAPASTEPAPTTEADAAPTTAGGDVIDAGAQPDVDPWARSAGEFAERIGESFRYECPPADPDTAPTPIWGVETYTADSSVCWAAVHVGLITPDEGGSVVITIEPGQDAYASATGNGISSSSYAAWPASFVFPDAPPGTGEFEMSLESWGFNLLSLGIEEGAQAPVTCAPDGPLGTVWGSGPYTGDSSICTAGVHAGLFALDAGGTVVVEALGAQESFEGSDANGVSTLDYGPYGSAFVFVTED